MGQRLLTHRIENVFKNFPFSFPQIITKGNAISNINLTKRKMEEFKEYKSPPPLVHHQIKLPRLSSKMIKNEEKELNFFEKCHLRDNVPKMDYSKEENKQFFLLSPRSPIHKSNKANSKSYSIDSYQIKIEQKKSFFTNKPDKIKSKEEKLSMITNSLDFSNFSKFRQNSFKKQTELSSEIFKNNLTSVKESINNQIEGLFSSRKESDQNNQNGLICNLFAEDKYVKDQVSHLIYIQKKFRHIIRKSDHNLFRNTKQE